MVPEITPVPIEDRLKVVAGDIKAAIDGAVKGAETAAVAIQTPVDPNEIKDGTIGMINKRPCIMSKGVWHDYYQYRKDSVIKVVIDALKQKMPEKVSMDDLFMLSDAMHTLSKQLKKQAQKTGYAKPQPEPEEIGDTLEA